MSTASQRSQRQLYKACTILLSAVTQLTHQLKKRSVLNIQQRTPPPPPPPSNTYITKVEDNFTPVKLCSLQAGHHSRLHIVAKRVIHDDKACGEVHL